MTVGEMAQKLYEAYNGTDVLVITEVSVDNSWEELHDYQKARWNRVALVACSLVIVSKTPPAQPHSEEEKGAEPCM